MCRLENTTIGLEFASRLVYISMHRGMDKFALDETKRVRIVGAKSWSISE